MHDYWKLRDELSERLSGVPGVLSVGVGRDSSGMVLVVVVDRAQFKGGVALQYKGVGVIVSDVGIGIMHSSARKGNGDG